MTKLGLILVLIALAAFAGGRKHLMSQPTLSCPSALTLTTPTNQTLSAELATTNEARAKGLSNRESLATHTGMLFLFPSTDIYPFWMKDTQIPLDIIWLNDKKVVEITSLEPANGLSIPQHTPSKKANAVLELNRGEHEAVGITLDSQLAWPDCPSTAP